MNSLYSSLCSGEVNNPNKKVWKAKIPLKIKIFMWLVGQDAILTKDNMIKHKWQEDKRCYFCNEDENISHIFFECSTAKYVWSLISMVIGAPCRSTSFTQSGIGLNFLCHKIKKIHFTGLSAICWAIWRTRNSICFDKKIVKSPSEIVCLASSFVSYWAGLHTQGDQQDLEEGAAAMREAALHFHQHHQPADQVDAGMVLLQSPVDGQDSGASLI